MKTYPSTEGVKQNTHLDASPQADPRESELE